MAEIGQQIFAVDGTRNFIRLYKEEFVRQISMPSSWYRARWAIMCQMTDTGSNLTGSDAFMGWCSGTSLPYASGVGSCLNAIGMRWYNTWTRNGTTDINYQNPSWYTVKRTGGADNTYSMGGHSAYIVTNTTTTPKKSLIVVDIIGQNNITIWTVPTGDVANDFTFYNFLEVIECQIATPSYRWGAQSVQGYNGGPGGSSTAPLDTINIYWGNGLAPLLIFGMAVYIFDA